MSNLSMAAKVCKEEEGSEEKEAEHYDSLHSIIEWPQGSKSRSKEGNELLPSSAKDHH